jgi:signal transduction histidine kinase
VEVTAFESEEEVVLVVDDDGPGVAPDQRTRVFEPFVRAPQAVERQISGHGLGLALIAHVARRHGGGARFIDGEPGAHLEIRLPKRG